MSTKVSVRSISIIGILVAMEVLLARFSIHTWNLKIGFSFIPVVVAAIFYGPVAGGLVGAIGDIISAVIFPVGAYFPGFTVTAFLTGLVFGWCLKKNLGLLNIIISVFIGQAILGQFLNTYWISILYGSPYVPLFVTRLYQTLVMIIVQIVCIMLIAKKVIPVLRIFDRE